MHHSSDEEQVESLQLCGAFAGRLLRQTETQRSLLQQSTCHALCQSA